MSYAIHNVFYGTTKGLAYKWGVIQNAMTLIAKFSTNALSVIAIPIQV